MENKERIIKCLADWEKYKQAKKGYVEEAMSLIEEVMKEKKVITCTFPDELIDSVRSKADSEDMAQAICLQVNGVIIEFVNDKDVADFGYIKELRLSGDDEGTVEVYALDFEGEPHVVSLYSIEDIMPVLSFILKYGYDEMDGDVQA